MMRKKIMKKFEPGHGFSKGDWDEVESPELTGDELAQARPFAEVFPDLAENIKRSRGRPKVENPKEAVTLRLSPTTLAKFKAAGPDWRSRMAETLDKAKMK